MTMRLFGRLGARRSVRFALAGLVNTAFGLSIYPLLLWWIPSLRTHYMAALLLAQVLGLVFGFATHKLGVFRTSRGRSFQEFGAFAGFYLINYAANWAALPLLVEAGHVSPALAQCGFTAVLIAGSWFWHHHITFRIQGRLS